MSSNTQTQTTYTYAELRDMTHEWLTRNGWKATTNRGDVRFEKEGHADIVVSYVSTTYYNTYLQVCLYNDSSIKTRIKEGATGKNYTTFCSRVHVLLERAWKQGQRKIEIDKRKAVLRKALAKKYADVVFAVDIYNSLNTNKHQLEVHMPSLKGLDLNEYDGGHYKDVFYSHNYTNLDGICILGWSSKEEMEGARQWRDKHDKTSRDYLRKADLGHVMLNVRATVKRSGDARFTAGEGYKEQIAEHPDSACAIEDILSNWDITLECPQFNKDCHYRYESRSKHQRAYITDCSELIGAIGATLKAWQVVLESSAEGLRVLREIEDNFEPKETNG